MTIQSVTQEIISGKFTNDELSSIIDSVKYAKARLQKSAIRNLMVGDSVGFTSSKTRQYVTGSVIKIAIKYVTVRTANGLWRVPANMLNIESEADNFLEDFNSVGSRHHY